MSLQELQNGLNAEIQGVKHGGFPLEVFPQKMQSLILTLASLDGFVVEFTASAMLVAAATAVGNARRLRVRGQENQSAKKGEAQIDLPEEPTLQKIVLNDFTYEAMMRIHDMNQRGIVVKFDEIIGMFKTIDRYSNSSTIEAFLSIFSGTPFSMTRCSNMGESVEIANPCVSIIGTTQTLLLSQIATQEFQSNGLLDRFLLVHPKDAKVALWDRTDATRETVNTFDIWDGILRNLFELDYNASIDRPYIRAIVRGKENRRVEFGAKVNNIMIDGLSFIEHHSFEAFNEGVRLKKCIEYQQALTGVKVTKVGADTIYANNDNRRYCTENGITTSFVRKGPKPKDENADISSARRIIGTLRSTAIGGQLRQS